VELGRTALYRKYRSRALDEVVGQDHITSVLDAAIRGGNFSHAYLLTGPRGIGKTSVARIIAHMVNGLSYADDGYVDIIEIDAASNTGVDNIRDLREKAVIMPTAAKYKVYIIDEVHMLSTGAFNALLKTLEEPPEHVIFILATTEAQKLPATILSRTQRFHFRPVTPEKVAAHLRMIADKEKIKIDDEALNLIARRGGGSFRDSITLLDQISGLGRNVTKNDVEDILGLVAEEQITELVSAIVERKSKKVIEILKNFRDMGVSSNIITNQLIDELGEIAVDKPKLYELIEKLIDVPKSTNPDIKLLTILVGASSGPDNVATKSTSQAAVVVEEKAKSTAAAEKKTIPIELDSGDTISKINWDEVVNEIKKTNGPCGSLIGGASIELKDNELTLYYLHKLHRTKMKDDRRRKVLSDTLINLYGAVPKIVVADGPKPKSETAARVADIMGGGELL
jgi:DNA polymerase-3 subunit gamma/tau